LYSACCLVTSASISAEIVDWEDNGTGISQPTQAEIDAEVTRQQAEYNTLEYARNRKEEYPDMGDQLNKIYDDGATKWKAEMVDPVKAKWPKDNSGPK
jgi:hypothetical protein